MARVRGIFVTGEQLLTCKFISSCNLSEVECEQLEQFKTSCFGHLLNIDKIQFSGQIVHGVVLRRVVGSILRCIEEDDIYKLALVYFAELVVLGRDKHLNINLNYLTLVEDLDAFNRYPWGSVSFDKTQDSLFYAPTKGKREGKSKVTGTSRRNEKGKKDKHGKVQRGGGVLKIWVYELIPRMADLNYCKVVDRQLSRILMENYYVCSRDEKVEQLFFLEQRGLALCPSEEEMRQPYWSWPQDRPAVVSAESIPSSCADLDELNKVVSLLRSELFQVKREKDVLELKVIRMEKLLDHCLGPQFEQEVRRDLALLKERTNRCASHIYLREVRKWMTFNGMKGQVTEMRERKRKMRGLKGVKCKETK
ncbi:hypothetical protein Prudu_463S000100, partial [Prunus dulcis]